MTEQELEQKIATILFAGDSFLKQTDRIMSLIKDNCWLKGDQERPLNPYQHSHPSSDKNLFDSCVSYSEAQQDFLQAGFKPCGRWE